MLTDDAKAKERIGPSPSKRAFSWLSCGIPSALLVPVHAGTCQRQIQKIRCEASAGRLIRHTKSAIVCLGAGDDMFNVRLPFAGEPAARVGTIDAAKLGDDPSSTDCGYR